jgi:hypothetical protein
VQRLLQAWHRKRRGRLLLVALAVHEAVASIGDQEFDRADIVLVGFVDGSWPHFEGLARAGLACDRDAGGKVEIDDLRAAAEAFRRSQALLAADELQAWLDERNLSRAALTAHLRRRVLVATHAGELDEIVARNPVPVDDVAGILLAEATFQGIIRRCADTAVEWAGAPGDVGLGPSEPALAVAADVRRSAAGRILDLEDAELAARIGRLLDLRATYERWVASVATESAVRACIDAHRMDWLRFDYVELRFDGDAEASEGAMCLREDGLEVGDVARMARAALSEGSVLLGGADRAVASLLVAAQPGDVVGPLPGDGGTSRLLVVTGRVPPTGDDPTLVARAGQEVVAAALEPLVAGMVRWHAPL